MPKHKKYITVTITLTEEYVFEDKSINGWTSEKVIKDWFYDFPLDMFHATRDTHRVGNSRKLIKTEVNNG
jgi:hypothetical protein